MPKGIPGSRPLCSISDCGKPHLARGWCKRHYRIWTEHGDPLTPSKRHGHTSQLGPPTPEYQAWQSMKRRCFNQEYQQYADYGGRGITVCPEWRQDFPAFLRHIGPHPGPGYSIDRIDNDGDYEPGNVRWATREQQARNTSQNRYIPYRGETLLIAEWATRLGLPPGLIRSRLWRGWSVKAALSTPPQRRGLRARD